MQNYLLIIYVIFAGTFIACSQSQSQVKDQFPDKNVSPEEMENHEQATFGAGCFWCVEAIYEQLEGVVSVEAGYCNGHVKNPGYKEVCTGTTGHAEVARIVFDPQKISFEELLEVFWRTHDPTTLNQQGADKGTQYRSGIYYHNETQKEIAEKSRW